jgi:hypothetical protein
MTSKEALDNLLQQGLKVGSKVRVVSKIQPEDCKSLWIDTYMNHWIGKEVMVSKINTKFNSLCLVNEYGDSWDFPYTSIELIDENKKKLYVDEEFVRQSYRFANSDWKKKIRDQFPDMFPEYYNFGEKHTIISSPNGRPLFIAQGLAPVEFKGQCLGVSSNFEMEIREHKGLQLLFFKPKH